MTAASKLYTNLQDFYNDGNNQESHVNSGIISHVLYQLAEGKTYNGISVQRQGNEKVSKVVMRALQNYATSAEDFRITSIPHRTGCKRFIWQYDIDRIRKGFPSTWI